MRKYEVVLSQDCTLYQTYIVKAHNRKELEALEPREIMERGYKEYDEYEYVNWPTVLSIDELVEGVPV